LYFFRRYLLLPTFKNACISGLAFALAQITKPLAAYLYAIAGLFLFMAATKTGSVRVGTKQFLTFVAIALVCAIAVLNVAYLFDRTFTPLTAYHLESSLFGSLQNTWPLNNARVPVPYSVLQGLDMAQHNDETGATYGNVYLLGTLRKVTDPGFRGFKQYYVVAWLFKEPIALQILFILGLVRVYRCRSTHSFLFAEGLLLVSAGVLVLVLVLFLSLFSKVQIGIRHILPALAVEVVIAGASFSGWVSFSRRKKTALALLVVWLAASTFSYYPHMIPYMNEWVPDRKTAYRVLADSNLDWNRNLRLVRNFLQNNPDVVMNPEVPVSGRILVSANRLVGITPKESGPLQWVLRYRPVAHVGYAHLLFNIPPEDVPERSR
jgi:hypothetical protein